MECSGMEGNAALFRWRESLSVESGISRNGTEWNGTERNGTKPKGILDMQFFFLYHVKCCGCGSSSRYHPPFALPPCPFFQKKFMVFFNPLYTKSKNAHRWFTLHRHRRHRSWPGADWWLSYCLAG